MAETIIPEPRPLIPPQSRSLPDLSILTSPSPDSDELDTPNAPPSPTSSSSSSDRHKWSASPPPPFTPSRSPTPPQHWDEDHHNNIHRTPTKWKRGDEDLPRELRDMLDTPKGSLSSGSPRHLDFGSPTRERKAREEEDEDEDGRRSVSFATFRDRNRSDYSIHSAPEFDSPTLNGGDESFVESPTSFNSPTSGRRKSYEAAQGLQRLPFSLWDYLQEEVLAVEMDGEEGVKSERVTNFLSIPGEVEKIILFGFVICLDSFLYTFTILPLRFVTAFVHLVGNTYHNVLRSRKLRRKHLRLSHKCDLVKALMIAATLFVLHRITDASKMYHSVRGQETIKLYVIFNVLEIADRLCCSFGQDLQDSLFSRQTFGRRTDGSHPHIRPLALFGLNIAYVVAHTLVLFYQLVTLNVAINSYSNALLTLLLSNQFVEIKGSVFKKFEKENLFQLTCADIVERFQLALMLFIIALRNLIELSSASSASLFSFLPASFSLSLALPSLPTLSLLQTIFSPALVVLLSECLVDWLKHAFITKFNHIRPAVYGRFIDVLCKDLVVGAGKRDDQPFVDQSPLVSRRLGFASVPLGCLVVRVLFQAFEMLADESHVDECAPRLSPSKLRVPVAIGRGAGWGHAIGGWIVIALVACIVWACLVAVKLLIGINLRALATTRWNQMEERAQEDARNDRGRSPIGVTPSELALQREAASILEDDRLDAAGKTRGGKVSLTSLHRYEMIKSRVW